MEIFAVADLVESSFVQMLRVKETPVQRQWQPQKFLSFGTKVVYMVYEGLTNKHQVVLEPRLTPITWDLKTEEPQQL